MFIYSKLLFLLTLLTHFQIKESQSYALFNDYPEGLDIDSFNVAYRVSDPNDFVPNTSLARISKTETKNH